MHEEKTLAKEEKGGENWQEFRKRMMQNEIMKAIVRKVDKNEALQCMHIVIDAGKKHISYQDKDAYNAPSKMRGRES